MIERPEGARSLRFPLVPRFEYVDYRELDDPLVMRREEDGTLRFLNDPPRFAATPEVLAGKEHITVTVRIAAREYVVDGCTRDGNLVLRRVRPGE